MTIKIIKVARNEIHATAKSAATKLGGKMVSLKGCNPFTGKTRGFAIVPASMKGGQSAVMNAMAIVEEA